MLQQSPRFGSALSGTLCSSLEEMLLNIVWCVCCVSFFVLLSKIQHTWVCWTSYQWLALSMASSYSIFFLVSGGLVVRIHSSLFFIKILYIFLRISCTILYVISTSFLLVPTPTVSPTLHLEFMTSSYVYIYKYSTGCGQSYNTTHIYACLEMTICGNLSGSSSLEKTDSPPLSGHWLPVALHLEGGAWWAFPHPHCHIYWWGHAGLVCSHIVRVSWA